jgi:hypothetical protein
MTPLDLNRRLATLLGWSDIIELGGALLGTPPAGESQCRGQALVPNWVGDWRDCGPLLGRYEISIDQSIFAVEAKRRVGEWAEVMLNGIDRDEGTRRAVVLAMIGRLEARQ